MTLQDICSLRAQKEDEKVELLNLEKEKAALVELLAAVRSQKEKEQVMIVITEGLTRINRITKITLNTGFNKNGIFTRSTRWPASWWR